MPRSKNKNKNICWFFEYSERCSLSYSSICHGNKKEYQLANAAALGWVHRNESVHASVRMAYS